MCTGDQRHLREIVILGEIFTGYNLRFYNIDLRVNRLEDCIAKLRDTLIENDLQLQLSIENAHRIGPFKDDGTPRPILAKFLYRPERFRVIREKRDLRDGVRVERSDMGRPSKEEAIEICYERGMKLGKDLDFIMPSYTLTVRYIRLEMFEQYTLLIRVSPIFNIFIALLLSFILNYILLIFDKQKLYANADQELSDPDLNLQLLNDHGIHNSKW